MKTLIDIDDEALSAAMTLLGTPTKVATVNEALRAVVRLHGEEARGPSFTRLRQLLHDPAISAFDDPEVMRGAWR